ncbi:Uncharacterised protein [Mycobacteroides abscessus]|nr:Uncharacterised protein [Mycobacteroides abscessus]
MPSRVTPAASNSSRLSRSSHSSPVQIPENAKG